jgi:integrase
MRTRVKGSSVNRNCKSLKAALNLAGKLDARVANQAAWRDGLSAVAENDSEESNIVLTDAQVRAVVAAAYTAVGAAFGLYAEVHAVTGARSSQIAHLNVDDLQMGAAPRLMVPSSLKGGRTQRTRTPVPIPLDLALRLSKLAAGRPARAPLLRDQSGDRWQPGKITYRCFADAVTAAGLVDDEGQPVASIYALRHTAITRMLLANKPVRVVAANFDTSVPMIEKTYSKLIAHHSDNLLRDAVIDLAAPAGGTVVALRSA